MMEIDHIKYIFGSFSRRRQSQDVCSSKRRPCTSSALKISHDRSNSTPQPQKKTEQSPSPRAKSVYCSNVQLVDESKFKCPMCLRQFIEPRVLPCLHTFCTRCLQHLEVDDTPTEATTSAYDAATNEDALAPAGSSGSESGSGGSGYDSEHREAVLQLEPGWSLASSSRRHIVCPTCGTSSPLPEGGSVSLPLHYILQHRLVLSSLNSSSTKLLCDLCTTEVAASCRCMECAISLCPLCSDSHHRQWISSSHDVVSIQEARQRGITQIRRQAMCCQHPDRELALFCSMCYQVICRDCVTTTHAGHPYEAVTKVVKSYASKVRDAVEKAKTVTDKTTLTLNHLHVMSRRVQTRCQQVQTEVEKFIDAYAKAVDEHRKNLNEQIDEARHDKLTVIEQRQQATLARLKVAKDVVLFADELLTEGTDVEIMSFVAPILQRLDWCLETELQDLKVSESLQFLPEECIVASEGCKLYGVITTQTVAPQNCVLYAEGLQNLRVGRRTEVILETRDKNDSCLEHGGEKVTADLRRHDIGTTKCIPVQIKDKRDGTYSIAFLSDLPGKFTLTVHVKGESIKDNPFPVTIRSLRPHHGAFHCCSFCSSAGSKDASCGCGGKMPGGYQGCGHGHKGHPGRRHWSCCGNILEHSECSRPRANSTLYQFTL